METNLAKVYTIDWFINKFEAIPEEKWCVLNHINPDTGACCANGHCGVRSESMWNDSYTPESAALQKVLSPLLLHYNAREFCAGKEITDSWHPDYSIKAASINNGETKEYQQPTPKQRILAALYDIKKMQAKDDDTGGKVRTVYVSVPVSITDQAKELVLS